MIRRILEHLELWEEEPRPPPVPLELVYEPDVDYVVPEIKIGREPPGLRVKLRLEGASAHDFSPGYSLTGCGMPDMLRSVAGSGKRAHCGAGFGK